jgi:inorganic pyrophosphatase
LLARIPLAVGVVCRFEPVGVFLMEDENGMDEKIIAIPHADLNPYYSKVKEYTDLPELEIAEIENFFVHYKDLEKDKWVKALGWEGSEVAKKLIMEGIKRAGNYYG